MSVRRATQCLGKLPDKSSRSGHSFNPASPIWPGKLSNPSSPLRWHDERETSKLIQAASPRASSADASDRLFRSRETVKAWLEASPTSVLDDHHLDGDTSAHSSLESFNSTPLGSPFHRSVTSSRFLSPCPSVTRQAGFLSPCSTTHQPGLVRVSFSIPNVLKNVIFFYAVFDIVCETYRGMVCECRLEPSRRQDAPLQVRALPTCRGLMQRKAPTSYRSLPKMHKVRYSFETLELENIKLHFVCILFLV